MTHTLLEEAANAPEPPETPADAPTDGEWGDDVVSVVAPQRTRQRRPRKPRVDPDTGEPLPPVERVSRNTTLKEQLLEPYVSLASDLATIAPTVAGVLIIRAEKSVDGMVDLASGHKRTMLVLKKVAKGGKAIDLLETLLLIIVAAAVDVGRLPLDSPLLDHLGHVEIARDSRGKFAKDEHGKMIKEKTTLREIRNKMVPAEDETLPSGPPPMPEWNVTPGPGPEGTGPLRSPVPMNNMWVQAP